MIHDFRSDTVTRPTPAMRRAMAEANVDDDVLGHDPTTLELEREAAALLGKESALFMPSGVMCNLVAICTHSRPGDEVITEEWAHTSRFETGGAGAVAHVILRTLRSTRGLMDADEIGRWISGGSEHTPKTALVCVEQSHNFHGGALLPIAGLRAIAEVARSQGVAVHMDGARIWNAVAASGVDAKEHTAHADTVSFCLSKGLGAPVGSLLCGPAEFLQRARFWRKRLGGGMRQSGILAAAGLIALREGRHRLADDHRLAKRFATALADIGPYAVDPAVVDTNIVFFDTGTIDAARIVEAARARDVLLYAVGPRRMRIVTHRDVGNDGVDLLLELLAALAR